MDWEKNERAILWTPLLTPFAQIDRLAPKGLRFLLGGEGVERMLEGSPSSSESKLLGCPVDPLLQMGSRENDVRDVVDTSTHALLKGERFERKFEGSLSSSEIDLEGFLVGPFLQMGWVRNDARDIVDTSTHAFGVDGRVGGEGVGVAT
jgi:hypothetical protein